MASRRTAHHHSDVKNNMPKINNANEYDTITITDNLLEKIKLLEKQKATLRHELLKQKQKPTGNIGYLILFFGAIILFLSIVFSANVLAFIGISLTFWGALILFIRPTRYIKAKLLETTVMPTFENIFRLIASLNYTGNGIFLPPQYSKDSRGGLVFIPSNNETKLPFLNETQKKLFLENPKGLCLLPSGLDLTNMFEDELGIVFAETKIENLEDDLRKLFIEDFEIADSFEIMIQEKIGPIIVSKSIYNKFCKNSQVFNKNKCRSYACPLCSSIACALTRVTGKPVTINNISIFTDNNTMQVDFQVLGNLEKVSIPSKQISRQKVSLARVFSKPNFAVLFPAVIGSIMLILGGWVIYYDLTSWGKDLTLIIFGSRSPSEAISLGIGMSVINYLFLGIALLVSSIFIFFRKRQLEKILED